MFKIIVVGFGTFFWIRNFFLDPDVLKSRSWIRIQNKSKTTKLILLDSLLQEIFHK